MSKHWVSTWTVVPNFLELGPRFCFVTWWTFWKETAPPTFAIYYQRKNLFVTPEQLCPFTSQNHVFELSKWLRCGIEANSCQVEIQEPFHFKISWHIKGLKTVSALHFDDLWNRLYRNRQCIILYKVCNTHLFLSFRNDEIMSLSHIVALLEQGNTPSIILDNSLTSSRFHDKSSFYKTRFSAVFSIRGLSWNALLWIETLPSSYTLSSLFSRTQHCDSVSFSIHSNRINLSFLVFLNSFSFISYRRSRLLPFCDRRILPSNWLPILFRNIVLKDLWWCKLRVCMRTSARV